MNAIIELEFSNLKSKHFTLQETYKERKEEYMSNKVKNSNEFKIEKNDLHQIIGKQFKTTNDTFSLMEKAIVKLDDMEVDLKDTKDRLNIMEVGLKDTKDRLNNVIDELKNAKAQVEILRTYRDLIGRFFSKLKVKLGGENKLEDNWKKIKLAVSDYYDEIDISNYDYIIKFENDILKDIDMKFGDFVLLFEMKDISNDTFYFQGWRIDEAKALLNEPFPDDLKKYIDPLQRLLDSWNIWRA